jgi:hypothetical protein
VRPLSVVVAANRVDECAPLGPRPRQVSSADGSAWCSSRGYLHVETSCRSGEGVAELFAAVLGKVVHAVQTRMDESFGD